MVLAQSNAQNTLVLSYISQFNRSLFTFFTIFTFPSLPSLIPFNIDLVWTKYTLHVPRIRKGSISRWQQSPRKTLSTLCKTLLLFSIFDTAYLHRLCLSRKLRIWQAKYVNIGRVTLFNQLLGSILPSSTTMQCADKKRRRKRVSTAWGGKDPTSLQRSGKRLGSVFRWSCPKL